MKEWNPETLKANWDFIRSLQYHYTIQAIYWNGRYINRMQDYVLSIYGKEEWKQYGSKLKPWSGHTRHFHIRIDNPTILKMKMARSKKPCC